MLALILFSVPHSAPKARLEPSAGRVMDFSIPNLKPLEMPHMEAVEAAVPVDVPKPAPVAPPAPSTPSPGVYSGSGDQYMDWIFSKESGGNPTALNSIGCLGLGQACPASKLYAACPTLEVACQIQYFTNYAVSRYGSTYNAYLFWVSHSWY